MDIPITQPRHLNTSQLPNITTAGIWLPSGSEEFFHHIEDRPLIRECSTRQHHLQDIINSLHAKWVNDKIDENKLDVSVVRRLFIVLASKGYRRAYPVVHRHHTRYNEDDVDPNGMLFTRYDIPQDDWDAAEEKLAAEGYRHNIPEDVRNSVTFVVLLVDAQGYYELIALHSLVEGRANTGAEEHQIRTALSCHLASLIGGKYYERPNPSNTNEPTPDQHTIPLNLTEYASGHWGVLNFTQLNIILESLHNANFAPDVFFHSDAPPYASQVQATREKHSLGNFASMLVAPRPSAVTNQSSTPLTAAHIRALANGNAEHESLLVSAEGRLPMPKIAADLFTTILSETAREHILRQFLRAITTYTLLTTKRRIERCRRALLEEMILAISPRQFIHQIKSPDDEDRIDDVTEVQLRTYVMLFAAKFPLLINVDRQIKAALDQIEDKDALAALLPLYQGWQTLLEAIHNDIESLENAVEQSRLDQLLQEEEQIRTEQETLSEISRLRERAQKNVSPSMATTINVIAVLATMFTIFLTFLSSIHVGLTHLLTALLGDFESNALIYGALFITLIIAAILLYFIFFFVVRLIAQFFIYESRGGDESHYYELDVHIDETLEDAEAKRLFTSQRFAQVIKAYQFTDIKPAPVPAESLPKEEGDIVQGGSIRSSSIVDQQEQQPPQKCVVKPSERNSYRVERFDNNRAMHKLYAETDLWIPCKREFMRLGTWRGRMSLRLYLVYEILFERPSGVPGYRFKDLRVVAIEKPVLELHQIELLKAVVIDCFINSWLASAKQLSTVYSATDTRRSLRDALFVVHEGYIQAIKPRDHKTWSRWHRHVSDGVQTQLNDQPGIELP